MVTNSVLTANKTFKTFLFKIHIMKFRLLAFICLTQLLTSCSKSGGGTPTPKLTATETSMLGTWYLKKDHYILKSDNITFPGKTIIDTVVTSFDKTPYIDLMSSRPQPIVVGQMYDVNHKSLRDNADLWFNGGLRTFRGSYSCEGGWYVDSTTSFLHIKDFTGVTLTYQFSVNSTDLIISSYRELIEGIGIDTLFFQR
jgi:hypothetical protein